jgi:hypothetical protein
MPRNGRYAGIIDPLINGNSGGGGGRGGLVRNDPFPTSLSRMEMISSFLDPRRDIDDECGYPGSMAGSAIGAITLDMYRYLYERECIATRVVQVLPKESWQVEPTVYEDEDVEKITPFEIAWDNLSRQLRGDLSYYQDEKGAPVWEYLRRLDILCGIGSFGVLLIGIDDKKRLDQPVDGVVDVQTINQVAIDDLTDNRSFPRSCVFEDKGTKNKYAFVKNQKGRFERKELAGITDNFVDDPPYGIQPGTGSAPGSSAVGTDSQYVGVQLGPSEYPAKDRSSEERKLLFLRPFDESLVQIVQYEANVRNPRFGQPVMYRITLNDPREMHSGIGLPLATVMVHWSRVIHVADNLSASEIFGVPRMRPVLNRLLDLRKMYGASGEGYWRAGIAALSLETHPQLGGDVELDVAGIQNQMENFENGLQKYLITSGIGIKTLPPGVVDPTPFIEVQLVAICIQLGIPKRVFMGSERGELASAQDDSKWNDVVSERENHFCTPRIIVPFIDRMIQMGILPEPGGGTGKGAVEPPDFSQEGPWESGGDRAATGDINQPATQGGSSGTIGNVRTYRKHGLTFTVNDDTGETDVASPNGYSVKWPGLDSTSQKDKAGIALTKAQAIAAWVQAGGEAIMSANNFYIHIMDMDEEVANEIVEDAKDNEDTMTIPPSGELGHPATPEPEPLPPVIAGPGGKTPGGAGGGKPPGMGGGPKPPKPQGSGGASGTKSAPPSANVRNALTLDEVVAYLEERL